MRQTFATCWAGRQVALYSLASVVSTKPPRLGGDEIGRHFDRAVMDSGSGMLSADRIHHLKSQGAVMRRLFQCAVLLLAAVAAHGQTPTISRAERLAKAAGLEELVSSAQQANVADAKAQADALIAQLRQAGMPESVVAQLAPRVQEIMRKVSQAWDPKVAARIYAEGLGDALTDDELDQAERYYGSTEGKKTHAAITASQQKMQTYVMGKSNEVLQSEMAGFLETVKKAVAERPKH